VTSLKRLAFIYRYTGLIGVESGEYVGYSST
jgi:hypothetical protein